MATPYTQVFQSPTINVPISNHCRDRELRFRKETAIAKEETLRRVLRKELKQAEK